MDGHLLLPPLAGAARDARRYTETWFREHRLPRADDAVLLVSELVTNALRHTSTGAELRLQHVDRHVRIEVHDRDGTPPSARALDTDAIDGRGLHLVSTLADRWGWTATSEGKHVWCELDLAD